MKKKNLKAAIAESRGTTAQGSDMLSPFLRHIAEEVIAEHLTEMKDNFQKDLDDMRQMFITEATDIVREAVKQNWEKLRGPQGEPGDDGDPAEQVDLEVVATAAAAKVKAPTVDYDKITSVIEEKVREVMPEQELDEEGEPIPASELDAAAILEKIHSVPGGIKPEAVRGLSIWMKTIQNSLREATRNRKQEHGGGEGGGGGGMGNAVHAQFPVTSATTTITLPSKIAANGFAVWAYYNNGYLVRGTDYTVGTNRKTLTLIFGPQDPMPGQVNTINVVYIRA